MRFYTLHDPDTDEILETVNRDEQDPRPQSRGVRVKEWKSAKEREQDPDVIAFKLTGYADRLIVEANLEKSTEAYAGKREDAERWMALYGHDESALLPATGFDYLRIEVEECHCTPFEAATDIINAVKRVITKERDRVRKREYARKIKKDMRVQIEQ